MQFNSNILDLRVQQDGIKQIKGIMAKHDVLNPRKRLRLKLATRGKYMKDRHKERPKKGYT